LQPLKANASNVFMTENTLKNDINLNQLPKHIAVIMDGNGRWAKELGKDRLHGHVAGVESVRDVVEGAAELGVEYLTLYTFSTENWNRPEYEVDGLMALLVDTIKKEVPTLHKNNIRLHVIGHTDLLPEHTKNQLFQAIEETSVNNGLNLIMALSYSSRWEIEDAIKQLALDVKNNKLEPDDIDGTTFGKYLNTKHIPDPELLIRTSGEYRLSNFLLYQLAYTELHFTNTRWPDFRKENLYAAILDYQGRERRFGKTGDQIKETK
jgi:undecaprenyl diphosphate synthase